MKPICVINVTILWDYEADSNRSPLPSRSIFIHIYASIWKIYHEHIGYDPKDGELCLIRSKSGETLMEDRSSSDVQIDCQN